MRDNDGNIIKSNIIKFENNNISILSNLLQYFTAIFGLSPFQGDISHLILEYLVKKFIVNSIKKFTFNSG